MIIFSSPLGEPFVALTTNLILRTLNLLYLHQHFCPPCGSGNNRSFELAVEWQKEGHNVTILCGSGQFLDVLPFYVVSKTYFYEGIKVIRFNVDYSHFMFFTRRLWAFFLFLFLTSSWVSRKKNFDLVYASSTPLSVGVLGVWCKIRHKIPMVFEVVDLWPDVPVEMGLLKNRPIIFWLYKLEAYIYRKADKIVVLSEGMKEKVMSKGIEEEKLLVAHNGSNCTLFTPCLDKASARHTLGYAKEECWVLYAGTVGQANELSFLIDVAQQVQCCGESNIRFVVLGDGNRKAEVMRYASLKGVSNMLFLGTVPKNLVKRYLDAADVGTVIFAQFPILETNSANKLFDYLASGLPVIINYGGWQKEYLVHRSCGASEPEVSRFAQKLLEWEQNVQERTAMGRKARDLAKASFDRKDIAHKIAVLFDQICKKA